MDFKLVEEHFQIADRVEILLKKGIGISKEEKQIVDKGLARLKQIERLLEIDKGTKNVKTR